MRVLFFGDGRWAALGLDRLIGSGIELAGVAVRLAPTDPTLKVKAEELGLPVYQPRRVNSAEFVTLVRQSNPELIVSVSYDQIFREELLSLPKLGAINFHAGKLPYYRGRSVINWAIINNETELGVTAHYINEGIDTGDTIMQRTVPIEWTDSYATVLQRVEGVLADMVVDTVRLIAEGRAERWPQSIEEGTYFCARREGDEWLDWSDSSTNLYNKIRAIAVPGPGARTSIDGHTLIIWKASYHPSWPRYIATPGEVVGRSSDGVRVKTGDSTIVVQEVQHIDGGERVTPQLAIGTRFEVSRLAALLAQGSLRL